MHHEHWGDNGYRREGKKKERNMSIKWGKVDTLLTVKKSMMTIKKIFKMDYGSFQLNMNMSPW